MGALHQTHYTEQRFVIADCAQSSLPLIPITHILFLLVYLAMKVRYDADTLQNNNNTERAYMIWDPKKSINSNLSKVIYGFHSSMSRS